MIYRTEHPKPQFEREAWENLNGEWQFEIDNGRSGKERKLYNAEKLTICRYCNTFRKDKRPVLSAEQSLRGCRP